MRELNVHLCRGPSVSHVCWPAQGLHAHAHAAGAAAYAAGPRYAPASCPAWAGWARRAFAIWNQRKHAAAPAADAAQHSCAACATHAAPSVFLSLTLLSLFCSCARRLVNLACDAISQCETRTLSRASVLHMVLAGMSGQMLASLP